MFVFVLQLRHMFEGQSEFYLFAFFSALIWALWLLKVLLSRRYKPYTGEFHGTTSVVIPVVDEPLDLFRDVLTRIVEQRPDEVIVVINGARQLGPRRRSATSSLPLVRWVHTPVPGKRNAVKIGTEMSRGEITVLVDSDTVWTDGTLPELVKPFADAVRRRRRPPASASSTPSGPGSPAGPTGWRTPGRSTRCPRSPRSARSAACRGAPSRSAGTSSSRSWTTS